MALDYSIPGEFPGSGEMKMFLYVKRYMEILGRKPFLVSSVRICLTNSVIDSCVYSLWEDAQPAGSSTCIDSLLLLADPDIRYCVLTSLDERFDPHLAQAENLAALSVALNDEVFEIRELAICTIGRLSSMNPAYVMPSLRKTLIQVTLHHHKDNIHGAKITKYETNVKLIKGHVLS